MAHQSDEHYDWQEELEALKRRACIGSNDIVYDSAAAVSSSGKVLKYAEGKPQLGLVPTVLTHNLARVYEYGLTKYHKDSWKEFGLDEARDLIHAALRHIDEYRDGEFYDAESGLPHLMQAIWNLNTIFWAETSKEGGLGK